MSSYPAGTWRGKPRLLSDMQCEISGRHVIVVEDIVDSGHTLPACSPAWRHGDGAASLMMATCLTSRRRAKWTCRYAIRGSEFLPQEFVVGIRPRLQRPLSKPALRWHSPEDRGGSRNATDELDVVDDNDRVLSRASRNGYTTNT